MNLRTWTLNFNLPNFHKFAFLYYTAFESPETSPYKYEQDTQKKAKPKNFTVLFGTSVRPLETLVNAVVSVNRC
jgi:hypothetical protein